MFNSSPVPADACLVVDRVDSVHSWQQYVLYHGQLEA